MARSYRKSPFCGMTTAESEKKDKQAAHRRERARVRTAFKSAADLDELVLPHFREVSNIWSFAKDGKQRFSIDGSYFRKYMRK